MAIILDQRAQLFQTFGSIATSAANAAAEGIAEAAKSDSKTADTAVKLFGGLDRSEFENISGTGTPNLLVPAVRPPASYEGPAEYFKPLSNTMEVQGLLVPAKDLLRQLEDPRFRMADGLSGFYDNRITKTLVKEQMILNTKPGGDVSLGGLNENGIIVVDGGKPADPGDMAASLDSFGKLYTMEKTIAKQLQLHKQLDVGAYRTPAPKQVPLPSADSLSPDQGLWPMPDVQAAAPQSREMLDVPLDHALNGTPETIGEMVQMATALQDEIYLEYNAANTLGFGEQLWAVWEKLDSLKWACGYFPPNIPPNKLLLEAFTGARWPLQQLDWFPMSSVGNAHPGV